MVEDSCIGTKTIVRHGRVAVRNLKTGRLVRLHAGQSYLARDPLPVASHDHER
jgi:hypothetical protein